MNNEPTGGSRSVPPLGFQPLPFGSARFGGFFLRGFPFGSRRCGMPLCFVRFIRHRRIDAHEPAGSVQSGTTYRFEAFGLSPLTRSELSLVPSCRPLPMLGGFLFLFVRERAGLRPQYLLTGHISEFCTAREQPLAAVSAFLFSVRPSAGRASPSMPAH